MPRGVDTGDHPGRKVHRERWIPNYDPGEEGLEDDYEPDFEAMQEARYERHRPDWA